MSANTNKRLVAIVTGASSGMGLGITRALLERGYRVVANSRTISQSRELKPSADLVLVDGDIGKEETAVKVVDAALKHFDRIDLLVNNAGIYMPKPFTEYTPEDFETMIGTNVAGYFFVTQKVVAQMRKQKSGHIVSISAIVAEPNNRWPAPPSRCPSLPNPPFQRSVERWPWSSWQTGFEPTRSRPVPLTHRCTPTTTMRF